MKSRRKFTKEFKMTAVRRLEGGQGPAEVARALEVHPSDLYRWRNELQEHGNRAFSGAGKKRAEESRVAELEQKVGQQAMEIDFLKRAGRGRRKCRGRWRCIPVICTVGGMSCRSTVTVLLQLIPP